MGLSPTRGSSFFFGEVTALGVLCCFALFVCPCLLLSSFLLLIKTCVCVFSESLNSYSSNPEKAGELFDDCIDKSHRKEYVPNSERKTTELFLGATAGMRLVR